MKLNKHGLPTSVCTNSRQGFQLRDILKSSPEEEDRSSRKEPRSYAKCSDMKKINKEFKKKKKKDSHKKYNTIQEEDYRNHV